MSHGFSTEGLQSESWDKYEGFNPDIVITVCDAAAKETCPIYFSASIQLHWGLKDPSKVKGCDEDKQHAFNECIKSIIARVEKLKVIASQNLSDEDLKQAITRLTLNNVH